MKKMLGAILLLSTAPGLLMPAYAQNGPSSNSGGQPSVLNANRDAYLTRMGILMEGLEHASAEQRKEIPVQMRKVSEEYRAANPPKELAREEIEARKQQMEEMLKKDPYQWDMYQLQQSMAKAKSQEERGGYHSRIQALAAKHTVEEDYKFTPEQRAEAQMRQEKNTRLRAELKPLLEQLHTAHVSTDRKAIHAQVLTALEKYR